MRVVELKLTNFRSYAQETRVLLDPLTVLVGRNDAGKSSILDALNIYFNDAVIEKGDCCVRENATEIKIACVFDELPVQLVLDQQYQTTLQDEYLVRADGLLEITKVYNCTAATGRLVNVFASASHPNANGTNDLFGLKIAELRARANQRHVNLGGVNQTVKAHLRRAIWDQTQDLQVAPCAVSLMKESGKEVWEQLEKQLPVYALFKSDRASTDQDTEAQDPLRSAVKEAIRQHEGDLADVITAVRAELGRVLQRTVEKIREMNPTLANQLHPQVRNKNWDSLFTVSLTGDEQIPINKRGSGTRRLVLLNFFRAKAEDLATSQSTGVIYAIEEPETSQHPNHQVMLLEAFEELVEQGRCQVLMTTHTPTLARRVNRNALRYISAAGGTPTIEDGRVDSTLEHIKSSLGVLADHDVKVFFGVEGKHDISFLKRISKILAGVEADIPDLENAEKAGSLVFVPLAGSNMDLWVTTLAGISRPEFYLTDRDVAPPAQPKYQAQINAWNARGCTAWATSKRELENYLHVDAIRAVVPGYPGTGAPFEDVPLLFAEAVHGADPASTPWGTVSPDRKREKVAAAKRRLNTVCVEQMTPARLDQVDPADDIRIWLRAIGTALNG